MFDFSSLWSSTTSTNLPAPSEEQLEEQAEKVKAKEEGPPKVASRFPKRPGGVKRMPSERPMGVKEFEVVSRAEKR